MVGHRHARAGLLRTLSVIVALGGALTAPTIVAGGDPCFHAFDNRPAPSTGATSQVVLGDCVFTPTVNSVPVGTTVTWRNGSGQSHEVVGSNLTWGKHDKLLGPGDTIGWTFEKAGVYAYSCMLHPGMTGTIIVGGVTSADAGALTSDPSGSTGRADAGGGLGGFGGVAAAGSVLALVGLAVLGGRRGRTEARG